MIPGDDHVAGAEQAEALAEGKMHVERDGRLRGVGLGVHAFEVVGTEIILPDRRRRIAGVTRAGAVVTVQKFLGDQEALAIEIEC